MAYVIVTGKDYMDIDMLAGTQALYEMMLLQGKEVYVQTKKTYSSSVTSEMLQKVMEFPRKDIEIQDELFAVDVSSVDYLGEQCGYPLEQFVALYDHHFESIDFWKDRLGEMAVIEEVGAAGTLVYELIQQNGLIEKIGDGTKMLLAAAIISNSQNFKFSMTTDRDRNAYNELASELGLKKDFPEEYLLSVQEEIASDVMRSLANDMKTRVALTEQTFGIAQLEMWNTGLFLQKNKDQIIDFLQDNDSEIKFFLSASLVEDKTYFVISDDVAQEFLENLLSLKFKDKIASLPVIMLRKEVVKLILEKSCKNK